MQIQEFGRVGVQNKEFGDRNAQENNPSIEEGVQLSCCTHPPDLPLHNIKQVKYRHSQNI